MEKYYSGEIRKSDRIQRLIDRLYDHLPEIEADRAVILTESYKETERKITHSHVLRHIVL